MTPIGLDALAAQLHDELDLFRYPEAPWVTPRTTRERLPIHDVTIVGAGQSGLGVAIALLRARIGNIQLLDDNAAGQEGPWSTYARMLTLRTLKFLTGPDTGLPAATYRAWHQAQFGRASYDAMIRIPKDEWMRYLTWLRTTFAIPVQNATTLAGIEPAEGHLRLHLTTPTGPQTILTRKLVLATGIEGAGHRRIPASVAETLPPTAYAHSRDVIDFTRLQDRRVTVVGAGASAFDNAATALEHGAARVDVLVRRPAMPGVNAFRVLENHGFFATFADQPEHERWRFMRRLLSMPMPPPQDTLDRFLALPGARIHTASPLLETQATPDAIRLRTPSGWHETDFLILGTGFGVDLARRPELASLAPLAATWADRYTPPASEADPALARYPYLGYGFELTERTPGTAPWLADIHLYTVGCVMSTGPIAGGINGMPWGVPRVVHAITRDLYAAELDRAYAAFTAYDAEDPWEAVKPPLLAAAGQAPYPHPMGVQIPLGSAAPLLRITAAQYQAMAECGAFAGLPRTELRDGVICQMNSQYRPHLFAKKIVYDAFRDALRAIGSSLDVASEGSVEIGDREVPMPDVIVWQPERGRGAIPVETVRLVVEVSETTLADDLGRKCRVYAAGGVPEYWVVDLAGQLIHQHSAPRDGAYSKVTKVPFGDPLPSASIPGLSIGTAALRE